VNRRRLAFSTNSGAGTATEARAATVARGEARAGETVAEAALPDHFSMRRFLHLLAVLDRLDHPH